jgi:DNA/RNA-binding domain of Phe-tRNA-synthetase-like protein
VKIEFPPHVGEKYKGLSYAFFRLDDTSDYADGEQSRTVGERITQAVRAAYPDPQSWEEHPVARAYMGFYASMGLNGRKCSNPVQQAYRFKTADYRAKTRVIDAAMEIEYVRGISFQLYDFDRVGDTLRIDIADRPMVHLDHRGRESKCREGELILVSERGLVHCPSLGNGNGFGLASDTRCALARVMLVPGLDPKSYETAIADVWAVLRPTEATYLGAPPYLGELSASAA